MNRTIHLEQQLRPPVVVDRHPVTSMLGISPAVPSRLGGIFPLADPLVYDQYTCYTC